MTSNTPPLALPIPVLFSADEIALTCENMARDIARTYAGQHFTIIALLKGSFVFAADLIRALHVQGCHPQIDFMTLSSYGNATQSSGIVNVGRDINDMIDGKHILLLDDILESGGTLVKAKAMLMDKGAHDVRIGVLLDKPSRRRKDLSIDADFVGFSIPDDFVIGYGLDYAGWYRELPYIGILPPPTA